LIRQAEPWPWRPGAREWASGCAARILFDASHVDERRHRWRVQVEPRLAQRRIDLILGGGKGWARAREQTGQHARMCVCTGLRKRRGTRGNPLLVSPAPAPRALCAQSGGSVAGRREWCLMRAPYRGQAPAAVPIKGLEAVLDVDKEVVQPARLVGADQRPHYDVRWTNEVFRGW
jgi:hypothetical protein